jgi:hypothetical protein
MYREATGSRGIPEGSGMVRTAVGEATPCPVEVPVGALDETIGRRAVRAIKAVQRGEGLSGQGDGPPLPISKRCRTLSSKS